MKLTPMHVVVVFALFMLFECAVFMLSHGGL